MFFTRVNPIVLFLIGGILICLLWFANSVSKLDADFGNQGSVSYKSELSPEDHAVLNGDKSSPEFDQRLRELRQKFPPGTVGAEELDKYDTNSEHSRLGDLLADQILNGEWEAAKQTCRRMAELHPHTDDPSLCDRIRNPNE